MNEFSDLVSRVFFFFFYCDTDLIYKATSKVSHSHTNLCRLIQIVTISEFIGYLFGECIKVYNRIRITLQFCKYLYSWSSSYHHHHHYPVNGILLVFFGIQSEILMVVCFWTEAKLLEVSMS